MPYSYTKLERELERFVASQCNTLFSWHWGFIKALIRAHAKHYGTLKETYKLFEDVSGCQSLDETSMDDAVLLAALFMFYRAAPDWAEANFHLEVAFGVARGRTRDQAVADQYEYLDGEGGYEAVYGQPDPRGHKPTKPTTSRLRVVKGGKSK